MKITTLLFLSIYVLTLFVCALFSWAARHTTVCLDINLQQRMAWEIQVFCEL